MAERREDAEFGGVANEDVQPTPAVEQPRCELVDLDEVAQVDGDERSGAAGTADGVVDLFEATDRSGGKHDMSALAREALGDGRADAPRGAGDQRDLTGEVAGPRRHRHAGSASSESCTATLPSSASMCG